MLGFVAPELVLPAPRWRHGLFILINALGAWLVLRRPPGLVLPFLAITLQQMYSHGTRALTWWHREQRVDWISLCIIVILPLALVLLIKDARERRSPDRQGAGMRYSSPD